MKYTIRLKFSNFFIHHYFQNQMFENFTYAFNMSNDAQIHVSRRVRVLFSRPGVATLRLKKSCKSRAQHSTCITCYLFLPCSIGKSVVTNKPE